MCASYETSEPIELADEIEEISGMALSRMNPKYFWAHTDSGGESALYVLNEKGELKGKIDIVGSLNTDWEDIAVGPCEKGSEESCIYIGDMGDNLTKRTDKKVYIVKEPRLPDVITPESIAALGDVVVWKTLHVKYPASKEASYYSNPDCESLMVSPKGEIFVVSKQSEGGRQTLYRMHRDGKRAGEHEALSSYLFTSQLGNLKPLFNAVTAADFAPDGKRFIVRTYAAVYEYDLDKYPDRRVPWHWDSSCEIVTVETGDVELKTPDTTVLLHRGDAVFVNKGILHFFVLNILSIIDSTM